MAITLMCCVPAFAVSREETTVVKQRVTNKTGIVEELTWIYLPEGLAVIAESDAEGFVFAMIKNAEPDKVYQWTGTELPATLNRAMRGSIGYSVEMTEQLENIECFQIAEVSSLYPSSREEKNAVLEDLEDQHGDCNNGWPVHVDRTTYAPLKLTVRETDYTDVEAMSESVSISHGIKVAAAIAAVVSHTGLSQYLATRLICGALEVTSVADEVFGDHTFNFYRGVYITERTCGITPSGGTETPVLSATRTYVHYYLFDQENYTGTDATGNMQEDDNRGEVIYYPSEYEYELEELKRQAYEEYSG